MKATAPAAHQPRRAERTPRPSLSPPTWLHRDEQDTPPVPPNQEQQHLPKVPDFRS